MVPLGHPRTLQPRPCCREDHLERTHLGILGSFVAYEGKEGRKGTKQGCPQGGTSCEHTCSGATLFLFYFFFKIFKIYLFTRNPERGRALSRGRSRLPAGSPMGTRSRHPGSRPGPRAEAQPWSPPGAPASSSMRIPRPVGFRPPFTCSWDSGHRRRVPVRS